jgi:hypothetical protein
MAKTISDWKNFWARLTSRLSIVECQLLIKKTNHQSSIINNKSNFYQTDLSRPFGRQINTITTTA